MLDVQSEAGATGQPTTTYDLLADEATRRSTVFRWRIWTGRPLLRARFGEETDAPRLPRAIAPYRFPINVIWTAGCFLFATTVSLVIWGLLPFLLIWSVGNWLNHPAAYVAGFAAVLVQLVVAVGVTTILHLSERDERRRDMLEWVRAAYAGLALPVLMYLTAASAPGEFTIFDRPASGPPEVRLWMLFYSYMYLDIISFGAIESLVGELTSLRPASFKAALFTFLTQSLMAASLLYHAFKYIMRRVFATEEFSGTFAELLAHLNDVAPAGRKCYVMPRYIECQVVPAPAPTPADGLFELSRGDVQINMTQQFRSGYWRFLKPGVVLQVVVVAVTALAMILTLLPVGTWGAVILILVVLVGLTLLIGQVLPALSRARDQAEAVKCMTQLRQLGLACLLYAEEHQVFPPSLGVLMELDPKLELALVCPTLLRRRRLFRRGSPPTRQQVLQMSRYVYLGAGRRSTSISADDPLIFEPADSHDGRGGNVLFTDGSVRWLNADELQALIARTNA